MQPRIWEKTKYFDGIRDFTALRQAGFAKIWTRDTGIVFCQSGNREIITTLKHAQWRKIKAD